MTKFLAVVKREYLQRVRAKMFIVTTILLPVAMSFFGLVPILVINIKTPAVRVAVVDQTGKLYDQLRQSLVTDESEQQANDARPPSTRNAAMCWILSEGAPGNWGGCGITAIVNAKTTAVQKAKRRLARRRSEVIRALLRRRAAARNDAAQEVTR